MFKLNSSYHLGYDQQQQKKKKKNNNDKNKKSKRLNNHTRNFPPGKKRNYFFVMAPHFRRNESFLLQWSSSWKVTRHTQTNAGEAKSVSQLLEKKKKITVKYDNLYKYKLNCCETKE